MDGAYDEKLWMDKYQPKKIEELDYNHQISDILKTISQKDDFPHLIFYGAEGAGKKTRIRTLLSLLYGNGVHKTNTETREFKVNSTTVEYNITSSNYHIELTPSDAEFHDRLVIQKVIKDTASTGLLDTKNQKSFKIIVLLEIDNLTKEAQAGLRRTMEKYMKTCRLIMCCNSLTKIIPPIRSRCLSIRVPCPTEKDITNILQNIKQYESINVSSQQIQDIVKNCNRNIRRAVNSLQLTSLESLHKDVFTPEYESHIRKISSAILKDQSAEQLKNIRTDLFTLVVNCVPSDIIFTELVKNLCADIRSEQKKMQIVEWGSFYDKRSTQGAKSLFHLEAFIARAMLIVAEN